MEGRATGWDFENQALVDKLPAELRKYVHDCHDCCLHIDVEDLIKALEETKKKI